MERHTITARVVADALQKFPDVASKTLARKLYADNGALWPTLNACLLAIRRQRGAAGAHNRANRDLPHHSADTGERAA